MLNSSIYKLLLCIVFSIFAAPAVWAEDESGPGSEKCMDSLDRAASELRSMQNNSQIAPATTSDPNAQSGQPGSSPASSLAGQMSQGAQQMAELNKQALEQENEIDKQRYEQLNQINDKIHEHLRGDFKRRMEIKNAETSKNKQEAMVRIKCQQKAEEQYQAELTVNNTLSQGSQYQVSDMSRMKGTNKRMTSNLSLYRRRCLANPSTGEELQMVQDEYDSKIHNFKIAQEEILSDINYQESKIGLLEENIAEQKRKLASSIELQKEALKQQQIQGMIQMALGALSSASSSGTQSDAAGTFQSADHILNNWSILEQRCKNDYSKPFEVPSDLYSIFSKVNRSCRGAEQAESSPCITSSGQQSTKPANNGTNSFL